MEHKENHVSTPEIDTPSTSAVLTLKQSMEGVAPKLDKEKKHLPNYFGKYASVQKDITVKSKNSKFKNITTETVSDRNIIICTGKWKSEQCCSSLCTSCQELFNSFSLVSSRACVFFPIIGDVIGAKNQSKIIPNQKSSPNIIPYPP